jgi:hypothetical protein
MHYLELIGTCQVQGNERWYLNGGSFSADDRMIFESHPNETTG